MATKMNRMTLYLIPIAIALNIVVSNIVFALKLPIWLDSIGVVLTAVLAGFWPAAIVGVLTGLASLITNPSNLFYIPLFVVTAFVAAFLARRNGYSGPLRAVGSGIVNGLATGITGSLITILVYGGLSSTGTGIIAGLLRQIGAPNWMAAMSAGVSGDITDKVITAVVVFTILVALPTRTLVKFPFGESYLKSRRRAEVDRTSVEPESATRAVEGGSTPVESRRPDTTDTDLD